MSLTGKDWWVWDADGLFWRAIRSGRTSEPVIIDPDPEDPQEPTGNKMVLLVTETGTLNAGNQALRDILVADGWTVSVVAYTAGEDYTDVNVVVLAGAGTSTDGGRYLYPPVGLVAVDTWRAVGMGTGLGFATSPVDLEVVDTASPLAAGYSGTFPAYLSEAYITWKPETDGALQTVVTRAGQPTERVVFAYEAGTQMPGRYATTRHVGLGFHPDGFAAGLSVQARAQFLASVRWARDTTIVPIPVPDVPTGLTASAGDGRVVLSWTAPDYAETYVVRRHTVTGGPYTDIESVSGTNYTDTTAVNATEYFYVVAAVNGTGVSDDSVEASATPTATSVENLSYLVSTSEIAMWQDRKDNGPFAVANDFSTNSPGHWNEMVSDSTTDWSTARWTGPQEINSDGSVKKLGQTSRQTANDPPGPTQSMALRIAGAAYVAVTNNNQTLAQNIINEIVWYSQQSRLDFSNKTLYPDNHFGDANPLFIMAIWISSLIKAYDACRAILPANSAIESWFVGMAGALHGNLQNLNNLFPNRASDNYVSRASLVDNGNLGQYTRLANGNVVEHLQVSRWYNNRRNEMAGVQGLAGLIAGNTFHIDWAKRYVREWVMFANRTTANQWTNGDHNRGSSTFPQGGYQYDINSLQMLLMFMEALARSGDTSLYDFSSSTGADRSPWGTNHLKTMKELLAQRIATIDQTIAAQYTASASVTTPPPSSIVGDPFYRIQSRAMHTNREIVTDGWLICAAAYYNEPSWVDVVLRQGTPTAFTNPPQPSGPVSGWSVDQRTRFLRSYASSPFT